jgi:hypothetical protein
MKLERKRERERGYISFFIFLVINCILSSASPWMEIITGNLLLTKETQRASNEDIFLNVRAGLELRAVRSFVPSFSL